MMKRIFSLSVLTGVFVLLAAPVTSFASNCSDITISADAQTISVKDPFVQVLTDNAMDIDAYRIKVMTGAYGCASDLNVYKPTASANHNSTNRRLRLVSFTNRDNIVGTDLTNAFAKVTNINLPANATEYYTLYLRAGTADVNAIIQAGDFAFNTMFFLQEKTTVTTSALLTVRIPKAVLIRVAASAGTAYAASKEIMTANFGELEAGESQLFYAIARSTANYTINISSANNFNMKGDRYEDTVDYSLLFEGSALSTSSININDGATPATGTGHELKAVIGSITGKRADSYTDTLTLEITPQS